MSFISKVLLVLARDSYRASKLAKSETIPVTVRELTDAECLELQLVENVQRADTHELDEGQGYSDLLSLQPSKTVEAIAAKVAKSPAKVSLTGCGAMILVAAAG